MKESIAIAWEFNMSDFWEWELWTYFLMLYNSVNWADITDVRIDKNWLSYNWKCLFPFKDVKHIVDKIKEQEEVSQE